MRPYKGLSELFQALAALKSNERRPYLLIAGEIWGEPALYFEQIKSLGLEDRVRFDNRYIPDEEVKTYFSAADCLVAPYTGGTQSGAVTIAISFGLPMIVTERVAEGIEDQYQNGLVSVVPSGDIAALKDAIQDAIITTKDHPHQSFQKRNDHWETITQTINQVVTSI